MAMAYALFLLTLSYSLIFTHTLALNPNDLKTYIIYMGDLPTTNSPVESQHINMLQKVVGSRASKSLLLSYNMSFNGFAATLTEDEKNQIARMDGVASVFPEVIYKLHTTRSWDFMGFPQDVKRAPLESDVIVGMIDGGIWPENDNFKDDGFGPPLAKWRGSCDTTNFTCNNKVIGAKYYKYLGRTPGGEHLSPRDLEGHGSHTASTAAGNVVNNVSFFGLAKGTARGSVPSARIAVYKACWGGGCTSVDIMKAFDEAIHNRVDIISVSLGDGPLDYFEDVVAIGAFHAMKRGILTSNSAGNSGPELGYVSNYSPWSLTVAASTIDRKFITPIVLGNNMTYEGPAINTFKGAIHPIVYGGSVPNKKKGYTPTESSRCDEDSLDPTLVKHKIVVCKSPYAPRYAIGSGASGTVIDGDFGYEDSPDVYPLPTTYLNSKDGDAVLSYINSTTMATAIILKAYEPVDKDAPVIASFSSRGPNPITADILKPDLTAPGVSIIAAWSPIGELDAGDTRHASYNIIAGTSMSCPHVSGTAAYVKSFHPSWSPAAIKSALMTTATPMSPTKNPDVEFAYGSGHINPLKAIDPGLVYDAREADFVAFLCGQGYNTTIIQKITHDKSACTTKNNMTVWDLNYPSFTLSSPKPGNIVRSFHRRLTNVGAPNCSYQANVVAPPGLIVKVKPSNLVFNTEGEKKSFVVTIDAKIGSKTLSGSLVWSDGVHDVRSPIVAFQK